MTIEDKILSNPDSDSNWENYISSLKAQGDMRGRLLELSRKKKYQQEESEFLRLLMRTDRAWIAKFIDFKGRVSKFREIEVKIGTYGSAPKKYGAKTYKVGMLNKEFLVREGWQDLGSGHLYGYVRPPENYLGKANKPCIKILIPEKEEMVKLAFKLKEESGSKKRVYEKFGLWITMYEPGKRKYAEAFHTLTVTKEGIDNEVRSLGVLRTEEEYVFGLQSQFRLTIKWDRSNGEYTISEYCL